MPRSSPRIATLIPACCLLAAAAFSRPATAQISAGGVYIDADRTVQVEPRDTDARLLYARRLARQRRLGGDLGYISLPRILEAVRGHIRAGEPVPDELRFLHGMVKLQYIFVYPQEGDLVIAGRAEPWEASSDDPDRPTGVHSGRPVLRLDDLVALLRLADSHGRDGGFGCSMDLPPNAQQRVGAVLDGRRQPRSIAERDAMARQLVEAIGPQPVRFFGVEPHSRIARVCIEADYLLKRLALGLDPSPVPAVRHRFVRDGRVYNRWWFTAAQRPLLASPDGRAFELRRSIRLSTSGAPRGDRPATPSAERYAEQFTENLDRMAAAIPEFADLWNLADMALLAALIRHDGLDERIGWDTGWLHEPQAYPMPHLPAPRSARTLVAYEAGTFTIGGVNLRFARAVHPDQRDIDRENTLAALAARPESSNWFTDRPLPAP